MAAVALMLALSWGGRRYAWDSPQIPALLLVSAVLWAAFGWRVMVADEPFIPLMVLRDGAMRVGTAVAFFGIGAYTSALVSLGFDVHVLPEVTVGLAPKPAWFGVLCAIATSALTGYAIGKLSFRLRGAYFVIASLTLWRQSVKTATTRWRGL